MPRATECNKITEFLRSLSADELVFAANACAGTLAARLVSYPDGQAAPGFDYPLYDADSAASAFAQAGKYITDRVACESVRVAL